MRRSRLMLVNVVLVLAVGVCCWRLRVNQERVQAREQTFAAAATPVKAFAAPAIIAPAPPGPAPQPVQYADIALHSLFSADRHPHIAAEAARPLPPPPPVPAFPRAFGVMDLGQGPVALLAWNGERQRPYQPGETLGPWKLRAIAGERITLEWTEQGRVFEKTLEELRVREPGREAGQEPMLAAQPVAKQEELTGDGPGPATGPRHRACKSGDRTPAGTVAEGYRKVETPTPFGNACRWEAVAESGRGSDRA